MLQNSYDIAIWNYGRMDGKHGHASAAYDYFDRDRTVYEDGYRAGRVTRIKKLAAMYEAGYSVVRAN